jgi:hypothetical protein
MVSDGFVDLKARREQLTAYRYDDIQEIMDTNEGKSQIYLRGRANPVEIHHTKEEVRHLIRKAMSIEGQ